MGLEDHVALVLRLAERAPAPGGRAHRARGGAQEGRVGCVWAAGLTQAALLRCGKGAFARPRRVRQLTNSRARLKGARPQALRPRAHLGRPVLLSQVGMPERTGTVRSMIVEPSALALHSCLALASDAAAAAAGARSAAKTSATATSRAPQGCTARRMLYYRCDLPIGAAGRSHTRTKSAKRSRGECSRMLKNAPLTIRTTCITNTRWISARFETHGCVTEVI